MGGDESFLSRWSQRKLRRDEPAPTAEPAAATAPAPAAFAPGASGAPLAAAHDLQAQPAGAAPKPEASPLPDLDSVAKLTRESDYAPYVNLQVDAQVRNAAMKKLFSDPHFNLMDGLDTYIDDYGKPDPLPLSMLRQMTSARSLGLFAEEDEAKAQLAARADAAAAPDSAAARDEAPKASPDGAAPPQLAQSQAAAPQGPHEDTDLRLQPHHAARRAGPEPGAGPSG